MIIKSILKFIVIIICVIFIYNLEGLNISNDKSSKSNIKNLKHNLFSKKSPPFDKKITKTHNSNKIKIRKKVLKKQKKNSKDSVVIIPKISAVVIDFKKLKIIYEKNLNFLLTHKVNIGSITKPFTIITADSLGVDIQNLTNYCKKSNIDSNILERCWNTEGHGLLNARLALANSCNSYFLNLSKKLTAKAMVDTFSKYYLINNKKDKKKLLLKDPRALATGIGYTNYFYLPNILFAIRSMLSNGIIYRINHKKKIVAYKIVPLKITLQSLIREGMFLTAKAGTSFHACETLPKDLTFAVKTGTSSYRSGSGKQIPWRTHGLCVFFTPSYYPRYGICVFVKKGSGSHSAVPIAVELFKKYCKAERK